MLRHRLLRIVLGTGSRGEDVDLDSLEPRTERPCVLPSARAFRDVHWRRRAVTGDGRDDLIVTLPWRAGGRNGPRPGQRALLALRGAPDRRGARSPFGSSRRSTLVRQTGPPAPHRAGIGRRRRARRLRSCNAEPTRHAASRQRRRPCPSSTRSEAGRLPRHRSTSGRSPRTDWGRSNSTWLAPRRAWRGRGDFDRDGEPRRGFGRGGPGAFQEGAVLSPLRGVRPCLPDWTCSSTASMWADRGDSSCAGPPCSRGRDSRPASGEAMWTRRRAIDLFLRQDDSAWMYPVARSRGGVRPRPVPPSWTTRRA